ncbi:MAG: HAD family hydrolase [Defluviitaleaceae bacterium]|nr:HAD family hydrolase [Defluviitaleaceae bacterium]
MDIKMLALDLDGALLRSDSTISQYSLDVLEHCRQKGIKITAVTARPYITARHVLVDLQFDAIIHDGGAAALLDETYLFKKIICPKLTNALIADFLAAGITLSCEGYENYYYNFEDNDYADFRRKHNQHAEKTDFAQGITTQICKINPRATAEQVQKIIQKYPHEFEIIEYTGYGFIRLAEKDSNKWQAVKEVAAHFGIDTASIAAFGDDFIDVELLANVGYGVAMANGIDAVKKAAKYQCDTNDNDGIARWLEEKLCL